MYLDNLDSSVIKALIYEPSAIIPTIEKLKLDYKPYLAYARANNYIPAIAVFVANYNLDYKDSGMLEAIFEWIRAGDCSSERIRAFCSGHKLDYDKIMSDIDIYKIVYNEIIDSGCLSAAYKINDFPCNVDDDMLQMVWENIFREELEFSEILFILKAFKAPLDNHINYLISWVKSCFEYGETWELANSHLVDFLKTYKLPKEKIKEILDSLYENNRYDLLSQISDVL